MTSVFHRTICALTDDDRIPVEKNPSSHPPASVVQLLVVVYDSDSGNNMSSSRLFSSSKGSPEVIHISYYARIWWVPTTLSWPPTVGLLDSLAVMSTLARDPPITHLIHSFFSRRNDHLEIWSPCLHCIFCLVLIWFELSWVVAIVTREQRHFSSCCGRK